jgi:exoribonuclease R
MPLKEFERSLSAHVPAEAAFMLAIRRAGRGASYEPYAPGVTPWHSAMAATYAHATAPLRRLADRYVVRAALAIANGRPVPQIVTEAFARLPPVMARADSQAGRIVRAVIDLAEAVMLHGREGETFAAIVTDANERGIRVQLRDLPIVASLQSKGVAPGDKIDLRLAAADTVAGTVAFEPLAPQG